jgi:hypothetical protein
MIPQGSMDEASETRVVLDFECHLGSAQIVVVLDKLGGGRNSRKKKPKK